MSKATQALEAYDTLACMAADYIVLAVRKQILCTISSKISSLMNKIKEV